MKILQSVIAVCLCCCTPLMAQTQSARPFSKSDYFSHLEVGLTAGSTGVGVDVSTPVGPFVHLRAGFQYLPRIQSTSTLGIQVGDGNELTHDEQGNPIPTRFDTLSSMLHGMTGYDISDRFRMVSCTKLCNLKVVADVMPFANKRWHISAGFFVGSGSMGKSYNMTEDMPSLLSVNVYNSMLEKAVNRKPIFNYGGLSFSLDYATRQQLIRYGQMGIGIGQYKNDQYYMEDVTKVNEWYEDDGLHQEIIVIHAKGDVKNQAGDQYLLTPDKDGRVTVRSKVNRFKPYVGFGYGGPISKDGKTSLTVDAGVLFWGGVPHAYTHDGICLVHDVEHIDGKFGDLIEGLKSFPVLPVLELKISRRIDL